MHNLRVFNRGIKTTKSVKSRWIWIASIWHCCVDLNRYPEKVEEVVKWCGHVHTQALLPDVIIIDDFDVFVGQSKVRYHVVDDCGVSVSKNSVRCHNNIIAAMPLVGHRNTPWQWGKLHNYITHSLPRWRHIMSLAKCFQDDTWRAWTQTLHVLSCAIQFSKMNFSYYHNLSSRRLCGQFWWIGIIIHGSKPANHSVQQSQRHSFVAIK